MTAFDRAWRILKMGQHSSHQIARYPIENKDDAISYLHWLENSPYGYHYDDDPAEGMVDAELGGLPWPDGLGELMGKRHKEMWQQINPWEILEQGDIEKASFDEQAYNNFKRLMAKNPDVEDGFEEGGVRLLDNGDFVDLSDGSRYRYNEETEDEEYMGKVPVEIGRGIEHKVYSIPQTQMREGAYVAKVPLSRDGRPDRVNRNEVYDGPEGVTRSPIEAYWSKVLGRSQPVLPYSLFNSKGSLDLVQRDMREYNPYIEPMSLQMAHLLGLEDVPSDAEDFLEEYDEVLEDTGEPPKLDTFGGLVGYGDSFGDELNDRYAGNVSEEGLIFDYGSKTPFVEDTRGGMIPKEQIERILQDAIHEQKNVPKRYFGYQSDLDQTIRQLISELEESSKKGRFIGSSISFPEIRRDM